MDPKATWQTLVRALIELDWSTAQDAANVLLHWLSRGGFPPQVMDVSDSGRVSLAQVVFGPELNRVVTESVCRFAISLASDMQQDASRDPRYATFGVSCSSCDCDSPASLEEAVRSGWTRLRFVPESPAENFLGVCPVCRQTGESAF